MAQDTGFLSADLAGEVYHSPAFACRLISADGFAQMFAVQETLSRSGATEEEEEEEEEDDEDLLGAPARRFEELKFRVCDPYEESAPEVLGARTDVRVLRGKGLADVGASAEHVGKKGREDDAPSDASEGDASEGDDHRTHRRVKRIHKANAWLKTFCDEKGHCGGLGLIVLLLCTIVVLLAGLAVYLQLDWRRKQQAAEAERKQKKLRAARRAKLRKKGFSNPQVKSILKQVESAERGNDARALDKPVQVLFRADREALRRLLQTRAPSSNPDIMPNGNARPGPNTVTTADAMKTNAEDEGKKPTADSVRSLMEIMDAMEHEYTLDEYQDALRRLDFSEEYAEAVAQAVMKLGDAVEVGGKKKKEEAEQGVGVEGADLPSSQQSYESMDAIPQPERPKDIKAFASLKEQGLLLGEGRTALEFRDFLRLKIAENQMKAEDWIEETGGDDAVDATFLSEKAGTMGPMVGLGSIEDDSGIFSVEEPADNHNQQKTQGAKEGKGQEGAKLEQKRKLWERRVKNRERDVKKMTTEWGMGQHLADAYGDLLNGDDRKARDLPLPLPVEEAEMAAVRRILGAADGAELAPTVTEFRDALRAKRGDKL
eukprot:g13622.t1